MVPGHSHPSRMKWEFQPFTSRSSLSFANQWARGPYLEWSRSNRLAPLQGGQAFSIRWAARWGGGGGGRAPRTRYATRPQKQVSTRGLSSTWLAARVGAAPRMELGEGARGEGAGRGTMGPVSRSVVDHQPFPLHDSHHTRILLPPKGEFIPIFKANGPPWNGVWPYFESHLFKNF